MAAAKQEMNMPELTEADIAEADTVLGVLSRFDTNLPKVMELAKSKLPQILHFFGVLMDRTPLVLANATTEEDLRYHLGMIAKCGLTIRRFTILVIHESVLRSRYFMDDDDDFVEILGIADNVIATERKHMTVEELRAKEPTYRAAMAIFRDAYTIVEETLTTSLTTGDPIDFTKASSRKIQDITKYTETLIRELARCVMRREAPERPMLFA
jgi:hypothetical protein